MSKNWLKPDLDKIFEDLYVVPFKHGYDLAVDMYDDNGSLVIDMNIPGALAKDVDITVENHYLKISGSRKEQTEKKDKNFYKKEIRSGSFERIIELPYEVDDSKAVAEFKNGMLHITLPKKKESESKRRIEVKS